MRVLLIGGNGFIGSHVVDELLALDAEVSVLSRGPERYRAPLDGVRYIYGSFDDERSVRAALDGCPETVIHLANHGLSIGVAGFPDAQRRNLQDSIRLFELCVEHDVAKIVFLSSGGKVYGDSSELPMREESTTNPLGAYGITKLMIEKFLLSLAWHHDFTPVIIRPSNPYGERQSPDGLQGAVAIFAGRMLQQLPITIWGDGTAIRDYLPVTDLARLCAMAATRECNGVFNAGSGMGVSTLELVDTLAEVLRVRPIVKRTPARRHDLPAVVLDSTRARQHFGWNPQSNLRTGLSDVAEWLRSLAVNAV